LYNSLQLMGVSTIGQVTWVTTNATHHMWNHIHMQLVQFNYNYVRITHYNKKGAYCDPNILANNKEIRFRKPAVSNKNSSQTLKPLRNPQIHTRTITSSSQLPKLNPSQHIFDYNVFYTRFAIHSTLKIIENKSNITKT
jgi:hypothetical protein